MFRMTMRVLLGSMMALWLPSAMAQSVEQMLQPCGSLVNYHFGPYDYRLHRSGTETLNKVEVSHFMPNQRRSGGDLDYTLRAFPNHIPALRAMVDLADSKKTEKPEYSTYTVSCWFERAIRFAPDDGTVRLVYGIYLARHGKGQAAMDQLESARQLAGEDDANLQYNLGLVYFDRKEYAKSLEHAQRAYALGFPLPGLKNKLQKAGKWRDPVASASAESKTTAPPENTQKP